MSASAWIRHRPATTMAATSANPSDTRPPRESVRKMPMVQTTATPIRPTRMIGERLMVALSAAARTIPPTSTAASWLGSPSVPVTRLTS